MSILAARNINMYPIELIRSGRSYPDNIVALVEVGNDNMSVIKTLVRNETKLILAEENPMHHVQARIMECGGSNGLREDV